MHLTEAGAGFDSNDVITKVRLGDMVLFDLKSHSLKLGGEIEYEKVNSRSANNIAGKFLFSSLADFENNRPSQFSQTIGNSSARVSQAKIGLFLQDYFKVSKSLQLSLGSRFEWESDIGSSNFAPGSVWLGPPARKGT